MHHTELFGGRSEDEEDEEDIWLVITDPAVTLRKKKPPAVVWELQPAAVRRKFQPRNMLLPLNESKNWEKSSRGDVCTDKQPVTHMTLSHVHFLPFWRIIWCFDVDGRQTETNRYFEFSGFISCQKYLGWCKNTIQRNTSSYKVSACFYSSLCSSIANKMNISPTNMEKEKNQL